MHNAAAHASRALSLLLVAVLPSAWAQTGSASGAGSTGTADPALAAGASAPRGTRLIEVMRTENANAVIEEVRIGGETHSIAVQPKGGLPAYEILPSSGTHSRAQLELEGAAGASHTSGPRVWKLFDF